MKTRHVALDVKGLERSSEQRKAWVGGSVSKIEAIVIHSLQAAKGGMRCKVIRGGDLQASTPEAHD